MNRRITILRIFNFIIFQRGLTSVTTFSIPNKKGRFSTIYLNLVIHINWFPGHMAFTIFLFIASTCTFFTFLASAITVFITVTFFTATTFACFIFASTFLTFLASTCTIWTAITFLLFFHFIPPNH